MATVSLQLHLLVILVVADCLAKAANTQLLPIYAHAAYAHVSYHELGSAQGYDILSRQVELTKDNVSCLMGLIGGILLAWHLSLQPRMPRLTNMMTYHSSLFSHI